MNKIIKRLLLGLLIWAIPFVSSFFIWDMTTNAPSVSMAWFNALMAFTWAIGFAIAAYMYFKNITEDTVKESWITGVTWYLELLIMDLIVLVGLFKMVITEYYPLILTYSNALIISVGIGYILKNKK